MLRSKTLSALQTRSSFRLLRSNYTQQTLRKSAANVSIRSFGSVINPVLSTSTQQTNSSSITTNTAFQDLLGVSKPNVTEDLKNTFYQRELPTTLVRFASPEGKLLFKEAMDSGHAEGFFPLTGNFTTQSEPAYCGPSSCK